MTWSSHDVWKKSELLQPIYLVNFRWGKSHTLVSLWKLIKDFGSRLWPFWTLFLRKNIHKQLLECMIMFAQSWQKWEAISKEYSESVSFAAVGFQKWKTWPVFTQIVGLKTKFPRRLSASRLYENGLILSGCLCWSTLVVWMQTTQSSYGTTVQ